MVIGSERQLLSDLCQEVVDEVVAAAELQQAVGDEVWQE
jgi:hypothetical protein